MWILDRGMLEFRTKTVILPRLQKATTANITLISMFLGDRHDGKYSMIQHSWTRKGVFLWILHVIMTKYGGLKSFLVRKWGLFFNLFQPGHCFCLPSFWPNTVVSNCSVDSRRMLEKLSFSTQKLYFPSSYNHQILQVVLWLWLAYMPEKGSLREARTAWIPSFSKY